MAEVEVDGWWLDGADAATHDSFGRTALDLAQRYGQGGAVALLEAAAERR